jgi:hypothetical protein
MHITLTDAELRTGVRRVRRCPNGGEASLDREVVWEIYNFKAQRGKKGEMKRVVFRGRRVEKAQEKIISKLLRQILRNRTERNE